MEMELDELSSSDGSENDSDKEEARSTILPLTKSPSNQTLKLKTESNGTIGPSGDPEIVICQCNKTCIHYIAKSGNSKKLNQVISNGFDVWSRDYNGRTALHWAASIGNREKSLTCVKLILDKVYIAAKLDDAYLEEFVNIRDYEDKATALYIAAKYENKDVCECLIKSYSDVTLRSKSGKTALEMIYKHIPEALVFMLDSAMERSGYIQDSTNILKIYIRTLIGQVNVEGETYCKEMSMLSNILYSPLKSRKKFLSHTLITLFLWLQWKKYQLIFWSIRIVKSVWLLLYFLLMVYMYRDKCPYNPSSDSYYKFSWYKLYPEDPVNSTIPKKLAECDVMLSSRIASGFLMFMTSLVVIFEIYQIVERIRTKKFKFSIIRRFVTRIKRRHIHNTVLIICVYVSCEAVLNSHLLVFSDEIYYMVAAIGVFLSWIVLFLEIGKIPQFRVHIEMLTTILKTFVRVMLTYISILIAFAMAFCILLPGLPSNSSLPQALLKMLIVMAGEPGYESIFYNPEMKIVSPSFELSMIFYGLCVALVTIVMLNYLIGLTVCDIQSLRDDAEVWKCSTMISQVYILESFLFKLPASVKEFIMKKGFRESQCSSRPQQNNSDFCTVDIRKLPKEMQREIRNWNLRQDR